MASGWGIRTMSAEHPGFNPFLYQNGSVWPHDNGLIALGCKRYGLTDAAASIALHIADAADFFMLRQLPELWAGIQRDHTNFPVQYLGANVPQGWAAGSVFTLVEALLGIVPDARDGKLYVDPDLPEWLPDLTIRGLPLKQECFDIRFVRSGTTTEVDVLKGDVQAVARRPFGADLAIPVP
jgi:glycogen debranching enzyme